MFSQNQTTGTKMSVGPSSPGAKDSIERSVDQIAEVVDEKEVGFLRGAAGVAGDDQIDGGETFGFATTAAKKRDAFQIEFGCGAQCGEDVGRVAAGGDADHEVAGLGEAFDLAREGEFEAVVVANAGDERAVGVERDGGERAAVFEIAADEFGGEMLRFSSAATVAADQEFFPRAEAFHDQRAGAVDLGTDFF